ncbi:MAG: hypothetical protein WDN46_01990 [Methylocella sp.]
MTAFCVASSIFYARRLDGEDRSIKAQTHSSPFARRFEGARADILWDAVSVTPAKSQLPPSVRLG